MNVIGLFKQHCDGEFRDLYYHRTLVLGAAPDDAKALGVCCCTQTTPLLRSRTINCSLTAACDVCAVDGDDPQRPAQRVGPAVPDPHRHCRSSRRRQRNDARCHPSPSRTFQLVADACAEQQRTLRKLATASGLTDPAAKECLVNNGWDFNKALINFGELKVHCWPCMSSHATPRHHTSSHVVTCCHGMQAQGLIPPEMFV